MKSIYKYPFPTADVFQIELPLNSEILSVQVRNELPCFWAMIDTDPETEKEIRLFRVFGTGQPITDSRSMKFIGTYQLRGGMLISHLFEIEG